MSTKRIFNSLEVAQRVRRRREDLGITREAMAELLGIGYAGYSNKETGEREISSTDIAIIARALDVTTDFLLGQEELEEMEQADRDTIRFIHNMPPDLQASARAAVRAMHDAAARMETTHGKKAE